MKRIRSLFAIAVLGVSTQLEALPVSNSESTDTADQRLHHQLCQINSGWIERTPDFRATPENRSPNEPTALIQTHLAMVIAELNRADISSLTELQRAQRRQHIRTLSDYMEQGRFPQNVFMSGYRPVFIDPWGTHCAVGHLIASSGETILAEAINDRHQLDFLGDIKTEGLKEWQVGSGLSMEELALIQPSYHSQTLSYPEEIEDLLLGDSTAIRLALEADPTLVTARCGGKTLLHYAATAGDLDLVKWLVALGAKLDAVSIHQHPVKPASEAETEGDAGAEKPFEYLRPSRSSTLYTVRWNEPTIMTPNKSGGLSMGVSGRLFSTKRGARIADQLADLRGGVADQTAIDFATTRERRIFDGVKMSVQKETDPELIQLNEDRAEVVAWLKERSKGSLSQVAYQ